MEMIYSFKNIQKLHTIYNIQARVVQIFKFNRVIVIILQDVDKNHIELISFDVNEKELLKMKEDHFFLIKNVKTVLNNKIPKTKHEFKLIVQNEQTKINELKHVTHIKNEKMYVVQHVKRKDKMKPNKQTSNKKKQLSMLNFINNKKC